MKKTIALAGNPNVGKSTVFNYLTGMRQHTGNWPGKTVELARGSYTYGGTEYILVDLPGTYSLAARSAEEEVARDFLLSGEADAAVVVCDATCLERNLNLVLQTLELTERVVVCVNLMDEAEKKGISIDVEELSALLGVPVVATAAGKGRGMEELTATIARVAEGEGCAPPGRFSEADTVEEKIRMAQRLAAVVTRYQREDYARRDRRLDRLFTSRATGIPVMLLLLVGILWLTIEGANLPSELLSRLFFWGQERLTDLFVALGAPDWLHGALVLGVYRVLAWVVSVMLPPMAIFFPLFTLLEDFGYLPRVAFVLDHAFQKAHACGKQALTMCMVYIILHYIRQDTETDCPSMVTRLMRLDSMALLASISPSEKPFRKSSRAERKSSIIGTSSGALIFSVRARFSASSSFTFFVSVSIGMALNWYSSMRRSTCFSISATRLRSFDLSIFTILDSSALCNTESR